jgi:hypothetical protein
MAVLCAAKCGSAQTQQETQDALHAMAQMADVIFTGQVAAVRRRPGTGGATGVVEIEFAIDDAVRGVAGSRYTVREWAGLWPAGDEPFRVGQRYLMLLHAPGPSGLSSPVGGMDGAIPIRGTGAAAAASDGAVAAGQAQSSARAGGDLTVVGASAQQSSGWAMDLGWVATRVVRPVRYAPSLHGRPIAAHAETLSTLSSPVETAADAPVLPGRTNSLAASAPRTRDYTSVLALLRGWEKEDHAGR